jgi:integrase
MEPPKTEIFTKNEAVAMLDCLSIEPLMYQVLINLAIVTGCRRGELMALTWQDIDLIGCTVSISKSNYKLKGEVIKTKQPKTSGSVRTIAVPQFIIEMFKEYKTEQNISRLKLGDQWAGNSWIFTQWNGSPMYPTTPSLWFTKFLKRNNIPHRKFHALRHTCGTLLVFSGTNIKEVGSRLGHIQLSTTNRYIHAVTEADKAAADILGDMLGKQTKNKKGKTNPK